MPRSSLAGLAFVAAGIAFIAAMTLVPRPSDQEVVVLTGLACLVCGQLGLVDVILNVLLFIPFGIGLGLLDWRGRRTLLLVAATTLLIETLQLGIIAGRDSSLSDLLTNTAGGMLGWWMARHWRDFILPAPGRARRLATAWGIGWVLLEALTAAALQPAPPPATWYGQRAPELAQFDQFRGTLLEAHLNGDSLPSAPLPNTAAARALLAAGQLTLTARVVPGAPTASFAPIASVYDGGQREAALLGRDGDDLIFRVRLRASDFRLRGPTLRLPDAFGGHARDTLLVEGMYGGGHLEAMVEGDHGIMDRRAVPLSPSWGWSMVMPYRYAFGNSLRFLTMLWIAGLLAPIGWWAARAGAGIRAEWRFAPVLAVPVLGLGVVPVLWGLPPVHPTEWLAAALGLALGLAPVALGRQRMQ